MNIEYVPIIEWIEYIEWNENGMNRLLKMGWICTINGMTGILKMGWVQGSWILATCLCMLAWVYN